MMGAGITRGWGPTVLAACLVAAVLAQAAQTILIHPSLPAAQRALAQPQDASAPRISIQPILDFQPFGAPDLPAPVLAEPPPDLAPAPDAPLILATLSLHGILQFDDPTLSRAMISVDGGPAQGFAVGDVLPDGSTVERIEAEAVWIDQNGQTVTLGFPEGAPMGGNEDVNVQSGAEPAINGGSTTNLPNIAPVMPAAP